MEKEAGTQRNADSQFASNWKKEGTKISPGPLEEVWFCQYFGLLICRSVR